MAPWLTFLRQRIKLKCHQRTALQRLAFIGIYLQQFCFVWKLNSSFTSSENPAANCKVKTTSKGNNGNSIQTLTFWSRFQHHSFLESHNPFSGILGQDLNLPWFQSFQAKPGFAPGFECSPLQGRKPYLDFKTACLGSTLNVLMLSII